MRRRCGDGCSHGGELRDVGAEVACCCDMGFDLWVLESWEEGGREKGEGTSSSTRLMRRIASCGGEGC